MTAPIDKPNFEQQWAERSVDLEQVESNPALTAEQKAAIARADIDGDGKIDGANPAEVTRLFNELDAMDGSVDQKLTVGERPASTPLGRVLAGLQAASTTSRPVHQVRSGENLDIIVRRHTRGMGLDATQRDALIDRVVDLNRDRYPSITRDFIGRNWHLELPKRSEIAAPPPALETPADTFVYHFGNNESPLRVIGREFRAPDGSRLSERDIYNILEFAADNSRRGDTIRSGQVTFGQAMVLPDQAALDALLGEGRAVLKNPRPADVGQTAGGAEVSDVPLPRPKPERFVDTTELDIGHNIAQEHVIASRDNLWKITRGRYEGVDGEGNARSLTNAEQQRIVDLLQAVNPGLDPEQMIPGEMMAIPSPAALAEHAGVEVRLKGDVAPPERPPVNRGRLLENLSEAALATSRATGVPPSVLIAEAVATSGWGQRGDAVIANAGSYGDPAALQAALQAFTNSGDVQALGRALATAGVADPEEAQAIAQIIRDNDLTRYDALVAPPPQTVTGAERAGDVETVSVPDLGQRQDWLNASLATKRTTIGFLTGEPLHNADGVAFPPWVNINTFLRDNGMTDQTGNPRGELTGIRGEGYDANGVLQNQRLPQTQSNIHSFVIHDTAGGYSSLAPYRDGRASDTRVNLFIGRSPGDYYLGVDFGTSRKGTKGNSAARRAAGGDPLPEDGFVSVELVAPLADGDVFYTEDQYRSLARAYIMASHRAGRMLTVRPHIEIDRGIPNGHYDPRNFNYDKFYGIVNRMLGMPEGTTYGPQSSRYDQQGGYRPSANLADQRNGYPNQYGEVRQR